VIDFVDVNVNVDVDVVVVVVVLIVCGESNYKRKKDIKREAINLH